MVSVFVLDTPENKGVIDVADADQHIVIHKVGPYFELTADSGFSIDRRATGCRHAVWYSCIAGLHHARIVQWDKDALTVELR